MRYSRPNEQENELSDTLWHCKVCHTLFSWKKRLIQLGTAGENEKLDVCPMCRSSKIERWK